MTNPERVSELTHSQEATCLRCEAVFLQTRINDHWWPKEHTNCPKAPPDPRAEKHTLTEAQVLEFRQRQREQMRQQALRVPPLYRDVTLDNFRTDAAAQRAVLARANEYVTWFPERADLSRGFPQVVIMIGPPGTGKGHIAWSIARAVSTDAEVDSVRVANCSDIIRDLRESWRNPEAESEAKRLRFYRELELLVIDEVSRHALYGEPSRHLYDLINHRQEWLRPTIITSNEDMSGIAELLGRALVSRAAGWGGVWQFEGEDYRIKLRKERERAS